MALIELVDYNTTYNVAARDAKKKTTRRGRKKATTSDVKVDAVITEAKTESAE